MNTPQQQCRFLCTFSRLDITENIQNVKLDFSTLSTSFENQCTASFEVRGEIGRELFKEISLYAKYHKNDDSITIDLLNNKGHVNETIIINKFQINNIKMELDYSCELPTLIKFECSGLYYTP